MLNQKLIRFELQLLKNKMEKEMKQHEAQQILEVINGLRTEVKKGESASQIYIDEKVDALKRLKVKTFGNKGRSWTNTGCITNLDEIHGECNPRLSSNSCTHVNIGCPVCLDTLKKIAKAEL
jgi:hypothetical protein